MMDSTITILYTFEHNMRIIDLAHDCVFINSSEKERAIKLLEEKCKKDSDINITDFFRQEDFVSDKRIEYLLAFDDHLQLHGRDQQFGRIAIANDLVSKENVAKALEYQKNYFYKNQINIKIGNILVGNGMISTADRISILLTQNRIKDENLLDAFNDIQKTQAQKDAFNRRVGALAVRMELVTPEQINVALEIQKSERKTQGDARFIGQILQETANVPNDDIAKILLDQRQFEKRRLDLEKALYTVKSEIKISIKLNKLFEYKISRDGIEAFVKKRLDIEEEIPVYEFLIWLRRAGIKFGIVNDAVLEEFIHNTEKNSQILIAKGYPAEQCTNESIQFYFENENSKPVLIEKGTPLARIIPGEQGKSGKDILGYPIAPKQPSIYILNAGSGVIRKGSIFVALTDGQPILKNSTTLMVEPVVKKTKIKTIIGNISCDTQNNYESVIVEMNGKITSEAIFKCHSLLLHGSILGSVITTGKVDIKGDIGTDKKLKDKDTIHQADLICQGSVKASKSITNSNIQTAGELLAANSTVSGSKIVAFKGITIHNVLKGEFAPSTLWFGLKPGDKTIAIDHTLEIKSSDLSILQKIYEIDKLKEKYKKDLKEETHEFEQAIFKNLIEIIQAPELYQSEGLKGKIKYLYSLPEFSSIKAYYLKIPETDAASKFLDQIMTLAENKSLDDILSHIQKKIDPEPEDKNNDEDAVSNVERIKIEFKARLAAFEQEIADELEEIEKIENEIKGLKALRKKIELMHITTLSRSNSVINIKNKCEKGTIIKGKIARHVVDKTVYNVIVREIIDPATNIVSISIETS
jgi:hypothetical protein